MPKIIARIHGGGAPVVESNMAGNFESDVLLQTISGVPQVLNVTGALTEDARIGITFGSSFPAPGRVLTNKLSENGSANGSAANFFLDSENPDSGNIDIILNNSGEAQLHTHEWYTSVSADFSTITVQCTAGGCEYADGVKAKIGVPFEGGSKIYDGEPLEAAVTFSDADGNLLKTLPDWVAPGKIVYTRRDGEELEDLPDGELPADAGSYKASVEYDALTGPYLPSIRVSFMIAPKPLTDGMVVLEPDVFQYDGTEKSPAVVVANVVEKLEQDVDYELKGDLRATDAGDYTITVKGKGKL